MLCLKWKGAIVSQHDVFGAGLGKTTHDAAEGEADMEDGAGDMGKSIGEGVEAAGAT